MQSIKERWRLSTLLSGLSLPTLLLLLVFTFGISSCSPKGALGLLTGGGTNVAANTQVGKTNTQTIGQTNLSTPTVSVRPKARVDNIDQSTKTENNYSNQPWLIIAFVVAVLMDSPMRILSDIMKGFKRRKKDG